MTSTRDSRTVWITSYKKRTVHAVSIHQEFILKFSQTVWTCLVTMCFTACSIHHMAHHAWRMTMSVVQTSRHLGKLKRPRRPRASGESSDCTFVRKRPLYGARILIRISEDYVVSKAARPGSARLCDWRAYTAAVIAPKPHIDALFPVRGALHWRRRLVRTGLHSLPAERADLS